MSGEKRQYPNKLRFIISFIILITAGWIINASEASNTATQFNVSVGEFSILDCNLSRKNITYPVHWKRGNGHIGIPYPKIYREPPIYYNPSLHRKYYVTYDNDTELILN